MITSMGSWRGSGAAPCGRGGQPSCASGSSWERGGSGSLASRVDIGSETSGNRQYRASMTVLWRPIRTRCRTCAGAQDGPGRASCFLQRIREWTAETGDLSRVRECATACRPTPPLVTPALTRGSAEELVHASSSTADSGRYIRPRVLARPKRAPQEATDPEAQAPLYLRQLLVDLRPALPHRRQAALHAPPHPLLALQGSLGCAQ